MHASKADPALHGLFEHVFHTLEGLTGYAPVHHGEQSGNNVDWYVVGEETRFTWFRLIGSGARTNPPNSILFAVPRDKRYNAFGAVDGNNWHGPSSDLIVKVGSRSDFANLLGYLRERYLQLDT